MKINELIAALEEFKQKYGDCEVEFLLSTDDLPDDLELDKIHVGYNQGEHSVYSVCEFRLSIA